MDYLSATWWKGRKGPSGHVLVVFLSLLASLAGGQPEDGCRSDVGKQPIISVIYITKRPGGYDVLFHSLAQQTFKDYELICIDDLNPERFPAVREYASRLKIPLTALLPSKPKVRGKRFGQCNAINSGLVVSRGKFITVTQDNVWLPAHFLQRTVDFFRTHPRDALLSYPERRVAPPPGRLNRELMHDKTVMSIFSPEVDADPVAEGWEIQNFNNTMTEDIWGAMYREEFVQTKWFECAACTTSWELYVAMNGLDEALDVGDDSQEANVKDRAVMLAAGKGVEGAGEGEFGRDGRWGGGVEGAGEVWNDLGSVVVLIDHHQFEEADETWARFERDTNVHRWRAMKDLIELEEYPVRAPNEQDLAKVRRRGEAGWEGEGVCRAEAEVVAGWEWSALPRMEVSEMVAERVGEVMGPRFGMKPDILVVLAMEESEEHAWEDGLREALRQLRRYFHITTMNVGHLRVEDSPDIDFQIKQGFHFMLGWGGWYGQADYFMRQYNDKENPLKVEKGQQAVRFGMLLRGQGGTMAPDGEAERLYEVVICDTQWQAEAIRREAGGLNVHHALGIAPEPFVAAAAEEEEEGVQYDVVTVGEITWESRPELLAGRAGRRLWVGRKVGVGADAVVEELEAGGVQVRGMPGARERAELYRRAGVVYFPMTAEGGGEMELLEAMAAGAAVEVEADNEKLLQLKERVVQAGAVPDHMAYAQALVPALWSVLQHGAAK